VSAPAALAGVSSAIDDNSPSIMVRIQSSFGHR
jgi:hypothetical protein